MPNWYKQAPLFDFSRGDFVTVNGRVKMVVGVELLKNKIEKIIRTERSKYKIYQGKDYGVSIENLLIGRTLPIGYVKSEIQRSITTALEQIDEVIAVESFDVSINDCVLNVSFRVSSEYGTINEEVII